MHNLKQHCDVTTRSWKKLADLSQSWSGMGLFPWRKAANLMCHISIEFIVLMIPEAVPFSPVRRNWNCSIRRSMSCNKTRDTCQLERNTNWRISRTSLPFLCRAYLAVQGVVFQSWLGVVQTSVQQRPPTTEPRSSYTWCVRFQQERSRPKTRPTAPTESEPQNISMTEFDERPVTAHLVIVVLPLGTFWGRQKVLEFFEDQELSWGGVLFH